ncbi:MAG: hypothetical protein ACHRXM_05310 [Isosphaerales bacterium]
MNDSADRPPNTAQIRYKKPKILTVDLPESLATTLKSVGYNITFGTLGRPYRVTKSDEFEPVVANASLPNYSEQEVVVIDLMPPETVDGPEGEKMTSPGELDWYAKASIGIIDPRPRVMTVVRDAFDRILETRGVFVVFAAARVQPQMLLAAVRTGFYRTLNVQQEIKENNWSFLSILSSIHLRIDADSGTEIKVDEGLGLFSAFLRRHLDGATIRATLHALYPLREQSQGPVYFPLATSKFGEAVAGIILPRAKDEGIVLILPQLEDKESAVLDLIQNILPEIAPRLFPDHEGGRWVHRDEYEHPSILERKAAQLEIQRKANEEVARLDREIEAERDRLGFLHGILTKSGAALVADVKRALEIIGFRQVVDVDDAVDAEPNKQEDLQVLDKSPSLLIEIKGLAGMPREGDTLQVTKYILRRIRQWDRTDVAGLSVINHQRNLPAMDRDHENAFTKQQIQDATQNGTGLTTTWDLFRLIRGMIDWQWPSKAVREVLYGQGRLQQHPFHYTLVGTVTHYWTANSVISIDVTGDVLRLGDRVGYLLADRFFEEDVASIQVDKNPVQEVQSPQRAGMKTKLARREVPIGTRVFRVGKA